MQERTKFESDYSGHILWGDYVVQTSALRTSTSILDF